MGKKIVSEGLPYEASDVLNAETTLNKSITLTAESTDTEYPSAKIVYDTISALSGGGYESVEVTATTTTLGDLADLVDAINLAGRHAFFDLHTYISGAYVCLIQKYTEADTDYMYIFDLLNRHIYGSLNGYSAETLITAYIAASGNNNDIPYVLRITDVNTTVADIIGMIDQVNALGQHVLIDVSALNTSDYLVTFTYTTGETVTSCKALGLVKGVKALQGYTTEQLSSTTFASFLATAGELGAYFTGTYAELKVLKDNSLLIPGAKYHMTDYTFTTSQGIAFVNMEHPFDLVLTAATPSSFAVECSAMRRTGDTYYSGHDLGKWQVKYCFDNGNSFYAWAPTSSQEGATGVIFDLIDDFGNHCTWDFKNCGVRKSYFINYGNMNCSGLASSSCPDNLFMFGGRSDHTMSYPGISFIVEKNKHITPFTFLSIAIGMGGIKIVLAGEGSQYFTGQGFVCNTDTYNIDLALYGLTYELVFENSFHDVLGASVSLSYSTLALDNVVLTDAVLSNSSAKLTDCTFQNGLFYLNNTNVRPSHTSYNLWNVTITGADFKGSTNNSLMLFPPSGFGFLSSTSRNTISFGEYNSSYNLALLQYFDASQKSIVSKLLKESWPGQVYSFSITDLYSAPNPIITTDTAWNKSTRAGRLTPNVQLPAPIGSGCEEKLTYVFTAASANASFTAPAGYILSDNTFTGLAIPGNTLPYTNLITDHIYIAKFTVITDNMITLELEDWGTFSGVKQGDILSMNIDGTLKNYRVLRLEGNAAVVLALENITTMAFDSGSVAYTSSALNTYLNTTWYNSLSADVRAGMVDISMENRTWRFNSGWALDGYKGTEVHSTYSEYTYWHAERQPNSHAIETLHVRAPEFQELLTFMLNTGVMKYMTARWEGGVLVGGLYNYMLWNTCWNASTTQSTDFWTTNTINTYVQETVATAGYISGSLGSFEGDTKSTVHGVRPVFGVNLRVIPWTKVQ